VRIEVLMAISIKLWSSSWIHKKELFFPFCFKPLKQKHMLRWAEYLEISGFSNMMSRYNQPVSLKNLAPNSTAQNVNALSVKLLWSEGLTAKVSPSRTLNNTERGSTCFKNMLGSVACWVHRLFMFHSSTQHLQSPITVKDHPHHVQRICNDLQAQFGDPNKLGGGGTALRIRHTWLAFVGWRGRWTCEAATCDSIMVTGELENVRISK